MKKTQRFVIICIFIAVVQFVYTEKQQVCEGYTRSTKKVNHVCTQLNGMKRLP